MEKAALEAEYNRNPYIKKQHKKKHYATDLEKVQEMGKDIALNHTSRNLNFSMKPLIFAKAPLNSGPVKTRYTFY